MILITAKTSRPWRQLCSRLQKEMPFLPDYRSGLEVLIPLNKSAICVLHSISSLLRYHEQYMPTIGHLN